MNIISRLLCKNYKSILRYVDFHYETGSFAGKTLTVAGLREALSKYPDDMPVFAQWEGCMAYVKESSFNTDVVHKGDRRDETWSLIIDVNDY